LTSDTKLLARAAGTKKKKSRQVILTVSSSLLALAFLPHDVLVHQSLLAVIEIQSINQLLLLLLLLYSSAVSSDYPSIYSLSTTSGCASTKFKKN
jgi:hypothetical protein